MMSMIRSGVCAVLAAGVIAGVASAQRVAVERLDASHVAELRAKDLLSRSVTVTLDRVPLKRAIDALAKSANVRISYREQMLDAVSTLVTLHATNLSLGAALDRVLFATGLQPEVLAEDVLTIQASSGAAASVAQGTITGKIIDAKTKSPLRDATVSLDGAERKVLSDANGTFRVANVPPGLHVVHIRLLGYVKLSKSVTVVDGQSTSVEFVLTQSVSALDQVVVTGTVVAMERRAVPNAMTVITAKEIEQRGITHIDQLFRGDVPGLFALNQGSNSPLDQVVMFSRGATSLEPNVTNNTSPQTNPMKTYVDGVELADASYLSQIDPASIERIEILTGPQASTIYGSNAINGVMQIFTKRGITAKPQLIATFLNGLVQNNFRSTLTPDHNYVAQVSGTEGRWSYNAGGSWDYMGAWTPSKQTARTSGFGGVSLKEGPVTVDATIRLSTTQNRQHGSTFQPYADYMESGWYTYTAANLGLQSPATAHLEGQTLGGTLGYAPTAWWSNEVVVGTDASVTENQVTALGYSTRIDTLLSLTQTANQRTSLRYASTVQLPVASRARLVLTVGGDGWKNLTSSLSGKPAALTGTLNAASWTVQRQPGHNAGGFVQSQLGLSDALFFTYGLRAEWNPNYGADAEPNFAPRYGVAYTRDIETPWGPVTTKFRGSYGRSTRPPSVGQKAAVSLQSLYPSFPVVADYGNVNKILANPGLVPEAQQGGEGGMELYFGGRGSLVVTRYNQTVNDLISSVKVDSLKSLTQSISSLYSTLGTDGYYYFYQTQYLNVGSLRNSGWEAQGTITFGPLTSQGTYSWTRSRVLGVDPRYRAVLKSSGLQPGASYNFLPEHTWALGLTYGMGATVVTLNVNGIGQYYQYTSMKALQYFSSQIRLTANRVATSGGGNFNWNEPGYTMADFNATHRFTRGIEGVFQMQNLTNFYRNDYSAANAAMGRQTLAGLRVR